MMEIIKIFGSLEQVYVRVCEYVFLIMSTYAYSMLFLLSLLFVVAVAVVFIVWLIR